MENTPNFYEVFKRRREIRTAVGELGKESAIFKKHYKKDLEEVNKEASGFSVANLGGLKGAKEALKRQKAEYDEDFTRDRARIDYEAIVKLTPELAEIREIIKNIESLKDFRMRRMLEILRPDISLAGRHRNEAVLKTVREEIKAGEEELKKADSLVLRQAELVKYKEDLAKIGHIAITPNVERDLDAIGDRMLTGKPMFLHGPTGTGKTSLARFAAFRFTGKEPEMVFCNP